jgi:hypothetical protein
MVAQDFRVPRVASDIICRIDGQMVSGTELASNLLSGWCLAPAGEQTRLRVQMNGNMVPMVLLVAAIALSWPKFLDMFRIKVSPPVMEAAVMSVAAAVFLGTTGLSFQLHGNAAGMIMCGLGLCAGEFLRRGVNIARLETTLSLACLGIFLVTRAPVL